MCDENGYTRQAKALRFAAWLHQQLPPRRFSAVADLNDNGAELAVALHERGYDVTAFGPRDGPRPEGVGRIMRPLERQHFRTADVDVVVSLWPGRDSWREVVRLAVEAGCPFALVLPVPEARVENRDVTKGDVPCRIFLVDANSGREAEVCAASMSFSLAAGGALEGLLPPMGLLAPTLPVTPLDVLKFAKWVGYSIYYAELLPGYWVVKGWRRFPQPQGKRKDEPCTPGVTLEPLAGRMFGGAEALVSGKLLPGLRDTEAELLAARADREPYGGQ